MNATYSPLKNCKLCPRKCGVDRIAGEIGYCGMPHDLIVARAALHMWEEPCISGENGSGTVFFSGCALHCVFCQNHNIANGDVGSIISVERLGQIFLELQGQGANNINLVTGTQFIPQIVAALKWAKENGLVVPVVYNTSAYEEVESLKLLEGYVDIYQSEVLDEKLCIIDEEKSHYHLTDEQTRAYDTIRESIENNHYITQLCNVEIPFNQKLMPKFINEEGVVVSIITAARGNENSVPINYYESRKGEVLIHNHPSGYLVPSEADLGIASDCSEKAQGFYIINKVENLLVGENGYE